METEIRTARNTLWELAEEMGYSKRQTKKTFHIYKHLPIKENDNVLIVGDNELLATWLLYYGIASTVEMFSATAYNRYIENDRTLTGNTILAEKPYLNKIVVDSSRNFLSHPSDNETNPSIDLVIILNNKFHDILTIMRYFNNTNIPRYYINLSRQMDNIFYTYNLDAKNSNETHSGIYIPELSFNQQHYLQMKSLVNHFYHIIGSEYRKVKLIPSFPRRKKANPVLKTLKNFLKESNPQLVIDITEIEHSLGHNFVVPAYQDLIVQ